jgi:hypothetical protein
MCFTKAGVLPKLITVASPRDTEQIERITKQEKTQDKWKSNVTFFFHPLDIKILKRIIDKFPENGLDNPSFLKITQKDGTSCEYGNDVFKTVTPFSQPRNTPVFGSTPSLELDFDEFLDSLDSTEYTQNDITQSLLDDITNWKMDVFETKGLEEKKVNWDQNHEIFHIAV